VATAEPSRTEPVRRRVAVAKAALALGAAAVFGGVVALTRQHVPGHPKPRPLRPLGVSPGYAATVRKRIGNSGAIQAPIRSPSTATHVS